MCSEIPDGPLLCGSADGGVCSSPFYMNRAYGEVTDKKGNVVMKLNVVYSVDPAIAFVTVNGVAMELGWHALSMTFRADNDIWTFKPEKADQIRLIYRAALPGGVRGEDVYYLFSGTNALQGNQPSPSEEGILTVHGILGNRLHKGLASVYWSKRK